MLRNAELLAAGSGNLDACDDQYRDLMRRHPDHPLIPVLYNQFRLCHQLRLKRRRPRVLVGGINYGIFPNFHTLPLLRMADVVAMQPPRADIRRLDFVLFDPVRDRFADVLKRLPPGFVPDLFWDCQAEHGHVVPRGLEEAPFPTAAGICHMWLSQAIPHLCQLFDLVAPLSKAFIPAMASVAPGAVLDLPFGGNWGSFCEVIRPCWEKTVDVAVTFGPAKSPVHAARDRVIALAKDFARRHGDRYRIEIRSGLPKDQYVDLLRSSRIAVNVAGVHGPYNYRICEAMNAGALVFHYEDPQSAARSSIQDYFQDGAHLVVFDETSFEDKLLGLLASPQSTEAIARAGLAHLTSHFSHDAIYSHLFQAAKQVDVQARKPPPLHPDVHHGLAFWYQEARNWNLLPLVVAHAAQRIAIEPGPERANNLMVLLGWLAPIVGPAVAADLLSPDDRAVASLLRKNPWQALRLLHDQAPSHLATRWNLAMLAFDYAKTSEIDFAALAAELDAVSGSFSFDPMKLVLHVRSNAPAQSLARWLQDLYSPLMYTSIPEQMDVYRRYMLACCRDVPPTLPP